MYHDQIFSGDDGIEYRVGDLVAYAWEHLPVVQLPTDLIRHNLIGPLALCADEPLWSSEFRRRAKRSHLRYPILVQVDGDGDHWIMDGAHRTAKAIMRGIDFIPAFVFRAEEMPSSALAE